MLMRFLFTILGMFFVGSLFAFNLKRLLYLDSELKENSGLVVFTDTSFLLINDGGNKAVVYEMNFFGKIMSETTFANATNIDWEELQMDNEGFIYIGDIGNNAQNRSSLHIYKFHRNEIGNKNVKTERIDFYYPEQDFFPPAKSSRHYDAEAFFVKGDSIIVLTKDWSKPFNGVSKVYYVPNKSGRFAASFIKAFYTKGWATFRDGVTGCCRYKKGLLILTYSSVYHIVDWKMLITPHVEIPSQRFRFRRVKQFEAIASDEKGNVFISAEKHRLLGRPKLYLWNGMVKK
jgi:hypothetical protein